jgi:hypothetical protein
MQKYLRQLLWLGLPLLLLAYPLDRLLSTAFRQVSKMPWEEEVWNDIYESKAGCEVAVYGSSRAWVQFDSKKIGEGLHRSVYNFGMDGHTFWFQYLRHRALIRHNPRPRIILLSLDVFTLERNPHQALSSQLLPCMLWDPDMAYFTAPYTQSRWEGVLPMLRYVGRQQEIRQALQAWFRKAPAPRQRYRGFKSNPQQWNSDLHAARNRYGHYSVVVDFRTLLLLLDFMRECRNFGTQLIWVYPPEYIGGQQFVPNRNQIFTLYRQLARLGGIPFLDYSNDPISLDTRYFYNASHMNSAGVARFTPRLVRDLASLLQ